MDKLETIFQMQKALNDDIAARRDVPEYTAEEWIQKLSLAMLSEMGELLDEVNFKWWKNPRDVNMDALRGELVDILHFFVSMCLRAGMDAETVFQMYLAKNEENFLRQQGKSAKAGYDIREMGERESLP